MGSKKIWIRKLGQKVGSVRVALKKKARLISIESQPKKVVVLVVFVVVGLVGFVGHKNLILKFGQNWANNK